LPSPISLPAALRAWSTATPERVAVRDAAEALTYAELAAAADDLGRRLASAGVAPGDRIALVAENRIEWVLALLACLQLGAVVVPLNVRLGPVELGRQLAVADPRLALHSGACHPAPDVVGGGGQLGIGERVGGVAHRHPFGRGGRPGAERRGKGDGRRQSNYRPLG